MKKLVLFAMTLACLSIFNACEKNESITNIVDDTKIALKSDFSGLDSVYFSVEKNRLVFESEQEFQKCINFLAQLGDSNFSDFEEYIGFNSYRKAYCKDDKKSNLFVDELYQTLLNPNMEIIVGDYLFREDPINKRTLAFRIDESYDLALKSADKEAINFSWNDNAFAYLSGEEEIILKSGPSCTSNSDHKKDWVIQSGTYPAPISNSAYAYRVEVKSKLNYQVTAIFKSIISKIKTESFDHQGMAISGQLFTIKLSMNGDYVYDRANVNPGEGHISEYKITNSSQDGVEWRPFYGTRRVRCYKVRMNFKWEVYSNWVSPQYYGQNDDIELYMECNPTVSDCNKPI